MTPRQALLDKLKRAGTLISPSIIKAFEQIDRADFVTSQYKSRAYDDFPLPIGYGQTISQPTTVAFMLERLLAQAGEAVLDVGSGSGWATALLANIVGPRGKVIGVERVEELLKIGKINLGKYGYDYARIIRAGDKLGFSDEAPYDRILVSAAALEVPAELIRQLKIGGTMILPVKSSLYKLTKRSGQKYSKEEFYGFSFVPLVEVHSPFLDEDNEHGQRDDLGV